MAGVGEESDLLARARAVMPGGVSSPVRSFREVGSAPPFVAKGQGAYLEGRDGRRYIDLVMSWGPLILGHAHPRVLDAVERAARNGTTFGATCEAEVELAERVIERFSWADKVRFVSSGTEAAMTAIRLARGATERNRLVKFDGCYHGHADSVLVKAGSGLATFGMPSSAGVPPAVSALTDVLPLDDEGAARRAFASQGDAIGAVIIEPLPANAGLLEQRIEFLSELRELTSHYGALLIFDEVISGFRVAPGGMVEKTGIVPDLVVLGKIIGGGLPVGAVAGPGWLMDRLAPLGPVYQAGTLSGNPLAMAAGIATLDELAKPGVYEALDEVSERLEAGLRATFTKHEEPAVITRVGSILWFSFQRPPAPRAMSDVKGDTRRFASLHRELGRRGVWIAPSAFEVAFVSQAHTVADVESVVNAFDEALDAVKEGATP